MKIDVCFVVWRKEMRKMTTAPVLHILFHFGLDRQAIEQMISADVFDREYNYTVKIMIQQMILLKAADDFPTLQKEISSSVENICLFFCF